MKKINTAVGLGYEINYLSNLESELFDLKQQNKVLSERVTENEQLYSEYDRLSTELETLKQLVSSLLKKE